MLTPGVYNSAYFEHTFLARQMGMALAARRGVCQDYAHVMIALVRSLAIPCRYVSGGWRRCCRG